MALPGVRASLLFVFPAKIGVNIKNQKLKEKGRWDMIFYDADHKAVYNELCA